MNVGDIKTKIFETIDGFNIDLYSETFQKDVFLFADAKGHFSDNFFNMLPNKTYTIHFKTESKSLDELKLKSFNSFVRETL